MKKGSAHLVLDRVAARVKARERERAKGTGKGKVRGTGLAADPVQEAGPVLALRLRGVAASLGRLEVKTPWTTCRSFPIQTNFPAWRTPQCWSRQRAPEVLPQPGMPRRTPHLPKPARL